MTTIKNGDFSITLASYENPDTPGHRYPYCTVEGKSLWKPAVVALESVPGLTQEEADQLVLTEAKRRIQTNTL